MVNRRPCWLTVTVNCDTLSPPIFVFFLMQVTVEKQPKSQVKLTVELSVEQMQPYLDRAAEKLSAQYKIEGFRPGKASLGIVVQKLGAQHVWEEAAEMAVRKTFVQAITDHQVKSIGQPHVSVVKLAADNPFIYTAHVAVLPDVTIGDYKKFSTKPVTAKVESSKVDQAIEDLRGMFATEAQADRPAAMGDKVEVDFHVTVDNVPLEGGSSKQHPVMLGSKNFIPGFEENIVGMKKEEQKKFELEFPKEYHNAAVAGKKAEFTVTVRQVFAVNKPEVNDEFAKQAGTFENVAALREQLEKNLQQEAQQVEDGKFERALLDEIIKHSKFSEIPDMLLDSELSKMIHELQEEVTRQGAIKWEDYLTGIKKSEDELKKEFKPQAERRVKSALVVRTIAELEKVTVEDKAVEEEVQATLKIYDSSPDLRARIDTPDYRDYVRGLMINRKVIEMIKGWATAIKE